MVRLKNTLKAIFIFTVSILCLTACPEEIIDYDMEVRIINNSEEDIIWYSYSSMPKDTTLMDNFPWYKSQDILINSGSSDVEQTETELLQSVLVNGYKRYYIFNYDSVSTIPWERIRDEYIVAKRVDFASWEKLEECNFTITYP